MALHVSMRTYCETRQPKFRYLFFLMGLGCIVFCLLVWLKKHGIVFKPRENHVHFRVTRKFRFPSQQPKTRQKRNPAPKSTPSIRRLYILNQILQIHVKNFQLTCTERRTAINMGDRLPSIGLQVKEKWQFRLEMILLH